MRGHIPFDAICTASAAAGEATRLRLLALLAEAELTVSELVTILGQSQPRISRHLKLLVEAAIRNAIGAGPVHALLDLGTGTGRMLELLGPLAARAVGIDQSPHMLSVARARIERAGLRNVQLRQGDIYAMPVEPDFHDLVIMHQVLHYLDDPLRAIREAARALRPGGRLLIVDFAPHEEETLRAAHAHRRLGFAAGEVAGFMGAAGLDLIAKDDLAPDAGEANKLTVSLWLGRDRRVIADPLPLTAREVA